MGYYTRILTPNKAWIPFGELQSSLTAARLSVKLGIEKGDTDRWLRFIVTSQQGDAILGMERNDVSKDNLGASEIQEFLEEIVKAKPDSAAHWLQKYLPTVQTIYAFEHWDGMHAATGQKVFDVIQTEIWSRLGGIFQADNEGFTNEEGYHILWQFNEHASGIWNMAVQTQDERWTRFAMNLGDAAQRAAFKEGKVPEGCQMIAT